MFSLICRRQVVAHGGIGKDVVNRVVAGLRTTGMYGKKPVVAELHGGQTDNNSTLFKNGYE